MSIIYIVSLLSGSVYILQSLSSLFFFHLSIYLLLCLFIHVFIYLFIAYVDAPIDINRGTILRFLAYLVSQPSG